MMMRKKGEGKWDDYLWLIVLFAIDGLDCPRAVWQVVVVFGLRLWILDEFRLIDFINSFVNVNFTITL